MPQLTIGDWLVNRVTNGISRGSELVHLEQKVVDLPIALEQRADQVVSQVVRRAACDHRQELGSPWPTRKDAAGSITGPIVGIETATALKRDIPVVAVPMHARECPRPQTTQDGTGFRFTR